MTIPQAHGGAPNAFVAEKATVTDALPLEEVTLLGVAGPDEAMRAMIRMSDGAIVTGRLGERIALGRLIEISPAGVVIRFADGLSTFLRPYPWGRPQPGA